MKRSVYFIFIFIFFFAEIAIGQDITSPRFYLDENGVTIKCENCQPGDTGTVNGILYEAVDRELLEQRRDEGTDLSVLCTSIIVDMNGIFGLDSEFNQDIGSWDVSNVTDMSFLFWCADAFNQDIGNWDVSNVTDMTSMFAGWEGGISFNQDIGSWDVANVKSMANMFHGAIAFNQDIGSWDVSNVTDMSGIFSLTSEFNQDIGSWDVSNVTDMTGMFHYAHAFNQDLSGWCVEKIEIEPSSFATDCSLKAEYYPHWGEECMAVSTPPYNDYNKESLNLYPNPTSSIFTLELENPIQGELEIHNFNGQLIYRRQFHSASEQIDLSSFRKGIYFITIRSKDEILTEKLIIL